jgi:large subunit ribosomal protein LP1
MSGEVVCSYAALLLHDGGLAITEDNINAVLKAANCTTEPYWPMLYVNMCKVDGALDTIIQKPGGGGGGDAGGVDGGAEEEKKEEEEVHLIRNPLLDFHQYHATKVR